MTRRIYLYDPQSSQIIEDYDVTYQPDGQCELLKVRLLARCKYPCEVIDTLEQGEEARTIGFPSRTLEAR
jgi:hypothetical protein